MPLSREQQELLEYLQSLLDGLQVTTYSENLELMMEAIDAALIENSETGIPENDAGSNELNEVEIDKEDRRRARKAIDRETPRSSSRQ